MVMTKGGASMPSGNVPNADNGDDSVCAPYDVPLPGVYPAPTPHAAAVGQEPFVAPEGDLNAMAHSGLPMTEGNHVWTKTPGKQ